MTVKSTISLECCQNSQRWERIQNSHNDSNQERVFDSDDSEIVTGVTE